MAQSYMQKVQDKWKAAFPGCAITREGLSLLLKRHPGEMHVLEADLESCGRAVKQLKESFPGLDDVGEMLSSLLKRRHGDVRVVEADVEIYGQKLQKLKKSFPDIGEAMLASLLKQRHGYARMVEDDLKRINQEKSLAAPNTPAKHVEPARNKAMTRATCEAKKRTAARVMEDGGGACRHTAKTRCQNEPMQSVTPQLEAGVLAARSSEAHGQKLRKLKGAFPYIDDEMLDLLLKDHHGNMRTVEVYIQEMMPESVEDSIHVLREQFPDTDEGVIRWLLQELGSACEVQDYLQAEKPKATVLVTTDRQLASHSVSEPRRPGSRVFDRGQDSTCSSKRMKHAAHSNKKGNA